MSFIVDSTATDNDVFGAGTLLNDRAISDQQKDGARRYLERHGALDVAQMLGLQEVTA